MRTSLLAALIALPLGACGGPSVETGASVPEVTLSVRPDVVAAGDSVSLTLRNDSNASIGYNLCTSGLERETAGGWQAVESNRVCTMELRTLEPGGEARYGLELPATLAAGEFRYHTTVERLGTGARGAVRSEPFVVRAGGG